MFVETTHQKNISHQQTVFPIETVRKSLAAKYSLENLVEKFKVFVQDSVPIKTGLTVMQYVVEEMFLLADMRSLLRCFRQWTRSVSAPSWNARAKVCIRSTPVSDPVFGAVVRTALLSVLIL